MVCLRQCIAQPQPGGMCSVSPHKLLHKHKCICKWYACKTVYPKSLQGDTVQLGSRHQVSYRTPPLCGGGAHARVGDCMQLLEGQAERHRLKVLQIMHHELTALC